MSKIRNIVKIMNFHSLLRVDSSRKIASELSLVSDELNKMICVILGNKNLSLDKKMLKSNPNGKIINIYLGYDLGFCGNFNYKINSELKKDDDNNYKIVIGKKIHTDGIKNIIFNSSKEDFKNNISDIEKILFNELLSKNCKEINVIYNKYININEIEFSKINLFPTEFSMNEKIDDTYDFVIETDVSNAIIKIITLYICHQLKIIEQNSYASENVMRQNITNESLKKIDDLEEEKQRIENKEKKYRSFQKQISNYKGIGSD